MRWVPRLVPPPFPPVPRAAAVAPPSPRLALFSSPFPPLPHLGSAISTCLPCAAFPTNPVLRSADVHSDSPPGHEN